MRQDKTMIQRQIENIATGGRGYDAGERLPAQRLKDSARTAPIDSEIVLQAELAKMERDLFSSALLQELDVDLQTLGVPKSVICTPKDVKTWESVRDYFESQGSRTETVNVASLRDDLQKLGLLETLQTSEDVFQAMRVSAHFQAKGIAQAGYRILLDNTCGNFKKSEDKIYTPLDKANPYSIMNGHVLLNSNLYDADPYEILRSKPCELSKPKKSLKCFGDETARPHPEPSGAQHLALLYEIMMPGAQTAPANSPPEPAFEKKKKFEKSEYIIPIKKDCY